MGLRMAGSARKAGRRYLVLQHDRWWFRRAIPVDCQRHVGRGKLFSVNLHTADLRTAQRLRDELERETSETFEAVRSGNVAAAAGLSAREQGILAREAIAHAAEIDPGEPDAIGPLDIATTSAKDAAESFRDEADRAAFIDALHGRADVADHLEDYLAASSLAPKTRNERRGNIGRFARWASTQRPALTLDRIDRKQAGRYVSEAIDGLDPATQKKRLAALRGYWRWLTARGHVEPPLGALRDSGWPWDGQVIKRTGKRVERGSRDVERAFTDDEIRTMLHAPPPPGMNPSHLPAIHDALRVSLLSGLRMAEVLTLWVEEVREGMDGAGQVFDIQQGKTEAAARPVPIHSALVDLVKRRTAGKDGKDWLFHELAKERDPGDTFGKRFRRYRLALGVDDRREGKRRSLVNFHSARRWFATAADRAGQHEAVIKDVIGHVPDKKNVTRSAYIARSSAAQMRACVESVRLPEGC